MPVKTVFVVLQNHHVDIIAEDADDYIAVYVVIQRTVNVPDLPSVPSRNTYPFFKLSLPICIPEVFENE